MNVYNYILNDKIAFVINPNSAMISEREGTMGCLLHLFVGLTTWGLLILGDLN